jgi:hypothetical protein
MATAYLLSIVSEQFPDVRDVAYRDDYAFGCPRRLQTETWSVCRRPSADRAAVRETQAVRSRRGLHYGSCLG